MCIATGEGRETVLLLLLGHGQYFRKLSLLTEHGMENISIPIRNWVQFMPSTNQLRKTESRVNAILLPIATCVAVTDPHVIGLFVDRLGEKTGLPETIGVNEMNVIWPEQRETIHAHGLHRKCSSIKIYMKRYSVFSALEEVFCVWGWTAALGLSLWMAMIIFLSFLFFVFVFGLFWDYPFLNSMIRSSPVCSRKKYNILFI